MSTRRSGPSWRHFYPRSPCGERPLSSAMSRWACLFLSTLSLRRATLLTGYCPVHDIDFYPRSPCGERPVVYGAGFAHGEISIHALLAESDQGLPHLDIRALDFYPRSPCGERRRKQQVHELWLGFLSTLSLRRATICGRSATTCARFLSTLSLRRATGAALWRADRLADFYPRSPCGERHLRVLDGSKSSIISIHALLAESDSFAPKPKTKATISIHALLAESDVSMRIDMGNNIDFYPRSPCGERRRGCWAMLSPWPISIHALLAESDKLTARQSGRLLDFYPRSPCGERRLGWEV